jgi:hypothetical protein
MIFSTVLNLVFIPVLYVLLSRLLNRGGPKSPRVAEPLAHGISR